MPGTMKKRRMRVRNQRNPSSKTRAKRIFGKAMARNMRKMKQ